MRIVIENGTISVVNTVDGSGVKVIQCIDPQGNVIVIPLLPDDAKTVGRQLTAMVLVANRPLPNGHNGGLAH